MSLPYSSLSNNINYEGKAADCRLQNWKDQPFPFCPQLLAMRVILQRGEETLKAGIGTDSIKQDALKTGERDGNIM